jgi:hypothetical protein
MEHKCLAEVFDEFHGACNHPFLSEIHEDVVQTLSVQSFTRFPYLLPLKIGKQGTVKAVRSEAA